MRPSLISSSQGEIASILYSPEQGLPVHEGAGADGMVATDNHMVQIYSPCSLSRNRLTDDEDIY